MMLVRRMCGRLWVLGLCSVLGCGGPSSPAEEPAPPPANESADAGAPTSAAPADASVANAPAEVAREPLPELGPPVVTLIDPGAEPRRPLRFTWKKTTESGVMDMKMALAMSMADRPAPPPVAMPTIRMRFDVKPESVAPDGSLKAVFELKKAQLLADRPLPDELKKELEGVLQKLAGLRVLETISSRGIVQETSVEAPADLPPQVQQMVENMKESLRNVSNPFPEEPVGKNAKWEVKTVVDGTVRLAQTATVTLEDLKDKQVSLAVGLVQTAPKQPMRSSTPLPNGAKMMLESHTGSGSGKTKVALDGLVPSSTMKVDVQDESVVVVGDERQRIDVKLGIETTMKPGR